MLRMDYEEGGGWEAGEEVVGFPNPLAFGSDFSSEAALTMCRSRPWSMWMISLSGPQHRLLFQDDINVIEGSPEC